MAGKDIIIMAQKELTQLHVIRKVLEKKLKQYEAGKLLGLSTRQIRRKAKRISEEGDKGVIHRSRGMQSHNARPEELKQRVRQLYREKYWDFGPLLASEKLFEIDKIKISDETLRRWLLESGDWKKRKKFKKHHKWRERKHYYGQMLQGDGSHHRWFEGRGPECVLMGFIDDATGKVFARFYKYEGTIPAMDLMKKYIRKHGVPLSIYMDNHSTYKSQAKPTIEDELAGREPLSQFERGIKELGIKFIHARSPQAKGRIERLFKTFQDRMIKEMRLAEVSSIRDGNAFLRGYLPKYNKRFSVVAKEKEDMHKPVESGANLDDYLCIKTKRTVRNDHTVYHNKKLYQIISMTKAKKVTVEDRISGKMFIRDDERILSYSEIKRPPRKKEQIEARRKGKKTLYIPPEDHPWRNRKLVSYPQTYTYPQKEKRSKKEKGLLLLFG